MGVVYVYDIYRLKIKLYLFIYLLNTAFNNISTKNRRQM
jgi:hypothetical protein